MSSETPSFLKPFFDNSDLENIPCEKIIQVFEGKDWLEIRSDDLTDRYRDCSFEDDFEIDYTEKFN